jgi:vacuolar-type H+-ATPase subunit C/Vma6
VSYDYGNARIAALRAGLIDDATLRRLAGSESPAAFLTQLERLDDWRTIVHDVTSVGADPAIVAETAIERHRTIRLGRLRRWYPPPVRSLVESLTVSLDLDRLVALLRRRRAGGSAEAIGGTLIGGAMLGPAELGRIARSTGTAGALALVARYDVIDPADVALLAASADFMLGSRAEAWPRFEADLTAAVERHRDARLAGRGADVDLVRQALGREAADRQAVLRELAEGGTAMAAIADRALTLERLDDQARSGRRDPLGIGTVIGYVASVEAQAIRLRAILARVRAGWPVAFTAPYLGRTRS